MCGFVWKKGQPRVLERPFTDAYYPKGEVLIIDGKEYSNCEKDTEEN